MNLFLIDYYSGHQIKNIKMGWACGTYGGCMQGFGGGTLRVRDHLENRGVHGRIILNWILKCDKVGIDWMIWLGIGPDSVLAVNVDTKLCVGFLDELRTR